MLAVVEAKSDARCGRGGYRREVIPGSRARVLRAALTAAAIAVGMVAAWIWPALAIATVWPFLTVVPGWALVAWASRRGARIPATGRLGLAVVLSVAVSAHVTWWLATLTGGYGREVVFAAAVVLAVPVPLAAWRGTSHPRSWIAAGIRGAWRAAARHPGGMVLWAGTTAWVAAVLARGLWQVGPHGVSVGGSNWSDLGVHLSIAQSVNAGNFPPQVPFFAGEPLIYHWFADFHAALLAGAAGLFAVPVFVAQSALLAGSLALVVHGLALALVRDRSARRSAFLGTLLVVAGGGLGWIRLVGDLADARDAPWDLLMTHAYDNQWLSDWPYFSIPSVMTTGLLVHRATTAGLPLLVGGVLLIVAGLPSARRIRAGFVDHPRLIGLSGVAGALLAPYHFFFFPVLPVLVLIWVLVGRRLLDRAPLRNALLFAAPYVAALPFAIAAFGQATGSGWLQWVVVWQTAPVADGPGGVLFFYLTNLGIPFALAVLALALRQTPARAFLALWIAILFLVPNLVQVSFVSFDMNKYFQAMWIAVAILAGWVLARAGRLVIAGALALSMASPILASVHTAFSQNFLLTTDALAAARWIETHTPERAAFVTDDWIIAPTDPAGRLRLTSFGPYIANLGYDPVEHQTAVHVIRCGGDAAFSATLMRRYGADYVLPDHGPTCEAPVDFAASDLFAEAYSNPTVTIFRLLPP